MDDTEDESSYLPQEHGVNSSIPKLPARNSMYSSANSEYVGDDDDVGDEESGDRDVGIGVGKMIGKDSYNDEDEDTDTDTDTDTDVEVTDNDDGTLPRKKRKLKDMISNYEFAPRVPPLAPPIHPVPPPRAFSGTRHLGVDWTERETFVLLDACGERFLQFGRKSLRTEEWQEVAEKISHETRIERTDTQCRNRLGTLKKTYKKEKMRLEGGVASKWPFYKKMDTMLDNPPPQDQQASLSCGLDSGEYVFMDRKVYLNRANGLDEMRDSPGNSESDGFPQKKKRCRGENSSSSFRLLANSMHKFSEIYEKIEVNKRKQMVELENMRMDFHRQLETQKRQLLERAQAEIAKIRQAKDEDDDVGGDDNNGNDLSIDD